MTTNQDREKFDAWWKAHCYDRVVIGKAVAVEIALDAWQAALQSQQAEPSTAQEVRSDIEIHLAHCFQPPYDTSCKYGDDECPATPKAAPVNQQLTTQAAAEPGDIRALKYRIHELEGEVIGYKRILDEQAAAEPVGYVLDCEDLLMSIIREKGYYKRQGEVPLYRTPPATQSAEKPCAVMEITVGMGVTFTGIPAGTMFAPGDKFRMYKEAA